VKKYIVTDISINTLIDIWGLESTRRKLYGARHRDEKDSRGSTGCTSDRLFESFAIVRRYLRFDILQEAGNHALSCIRTALLVQCTESCAFLSMEDRCLLKQILRIRKNWNEMSRKELLLQSRKHSWIRRILLIHGTISPCLALYSFLLAFRPLDISFARTNINQYVNHDVFLLELIL